MSLTGCTIQTIYPSDNPNEGRVKINQNFECLSNNISGSLFMACAPHGFVLCRSLSRVEE